MLVLHHHNLFPPLDLESPVLHQIQKQLLPEIEWPLELEWPLEQQKKPPEMDLLLCGMLREPPPLPSLSPSPLEFESPLSRKIRKRPLPEIE